MFVVIAFTHIGRRKTSGKRVLGGNKMSLADLRKALIDAGFSKDSDGEGWTKGFSSARILEIQDTSLLASYK